MYSKQIINSQKIFNTLENRKHEIDTIQLTCDDRDGNLHEDTVYDVEYEAIIQKINILTKHLPHNTLFIVMENDITNSKNLLIRIHPSIVTA